MSDIHASILGRRGGMANSKRKLTVKDVIDIRESKLSQIELARKYGVTQPTISHIRKRLSWKWVQV